jgi:hypothetical protein
MGFVSNHPSLDVAGRFWTYSFDHRISGLSNLPSTMISIGIRTFDPLYVAYMVTIPML